MVIKTNFKIFILGSLVGLILASVLYIFMFLRNENGVEYLWLEEKLELQDYEIIKKVDISK